MNQLILEEPDRISHWLITSNYILIPHREDGPAFKYFDGNKEYFTNGKRHRDNGPAFIWGDNYEYWVNGKLHRLDGPALFHASKKVLGIPEIYKYYINGQEYTKEDFKRYK